MTRHYSNEFRHTVVRIEPEGVYGIILQEGAYYSLVAYTKNEIEYEAFVENDDLTVLYETGLEYEEEE